MSYNSEVDGFLVVESRTSEIEDSFFQRLVLIKMILFDMNNNIYLKSECDFFLSF